MTTSITRPLKDLRTPQERQEAALVAQFRQMSPRARTKLLRQAKAILDEDQRRLLYVLRK